MRSSIAILTFVGTVALAHPSIKHRHLHQKRDTVLTTTIGNEVIVEDIQDVYVTVPPGFQIPGSEPTSSLAVPENLAVQTPAISASSSSSSSSATPAVQEKYAYPGGNSLWSEYHQRQHPSQSSIESQVPTPVETSTTLSPTTPSLVSPASPTEVLPSSQSSTTAPASVSTASAVSSPVATGSFWAKSPMSPLAGGSGSKDVLTQANYWRNKWLNLPPFTWSSTLANNSYMTATQPTYYRTDDNGNNVPHNEGGAMVMGHELYPGSSSQCIASGDDTTMNQDLTPFEVAFLLWICEEPNYNIPCAQIGSGKPTSDTGHADIIKGTVSQIGCYYMDSVGNSGFTGMWTCDFQEPGS